VDQNEDTIVLEYEIEFPKAIPVDVLPYIPAGYLDFDCPKPIVGKMQEPGDLPAPIFPPRPTEKSTMPEYPKTCFDKKKMIMGKPPAPLKPKAF